METTRKFLSDDDLEYISNCDISNGEGDFSSMSTIEFPPVADVIGSNWEAGGSFRSISSSSSSSKLDEILEPTPIDPNRVDIVHDYHDKSFLKSLRSFLSNGNSASLPNLLNDDRKPASRAQQFSSKGLRNWQQHMSQLVRSSAEYSSTNEEEGNEETARVVSSSAASSPSTSPVPGSGSSNGSINNRTSHAEQWKQRFSELVEFQRQHGHCLVPLNWPQNPSLAHWVKRQRYLFKLKREGKNSTLTPERQSMLEHLGFVWDSHGVCWLERWQELRDFRERYGHCNVPKKYPENQSLAIWVKCQRRQWKLFQSNGPHASNMTPERIVKLQSLGFVFEPRSRQRVVSAPF